VDWSTVDPPQIYKLLLASSAIPIIYPNVKFQGIRYEDGGLADNVPIRPLYNAGYRKFIAVYLQHSQSENIKSQIESEKKNFPDASIVRIFPREEMKDDIFHGFTINGKITKQRIKWGYEDAINVFTGCII
jgi:NTE family protein